MLLGQFRSDPTWNLSPSISTPQIWRQFTTPNNAAVEAAVELAADAQEYLGMVNAPQRPSEDLDFDDFLEHVHLTVTGALN